MFDLYISSLSLEAGQEIKETGGLYAVAPRKAARLRANDRLVLLFRQDGVVSLPPNLQQEMLSRLAETYYTSSGSVTAGMKAVAERLNDFLINRNLRMSRQQGGQTVGVLNMAVLRDATVSIAHAGPTHTLIVAGGQVERFTDASEISRELGLAKLVSLRFFQAALSPDALMILSSGVPATWQDAALAASAGKDPGALRSLLAAGALDLQAGIVRVKAGKGEVRSETAAPLTRSAEAQRSAPVSAPTIVIPAVPPVAPVEPPSAAPVPAPEIQTPEEAPVEDSAPVDESPQVPEVDGSVENSEPEPQDAGPGESAVSDAQVESAQGVYLSGKELHDRDSNQPPWVENEPAAAPPTPQAPQPGSTPANSTESPSRPSGAQAILRPRSAQRPANPPSDPAPVKTPEPAAPAPRAAARRPSAATAASARATIGLIGGIRSAWHAVGGFFSKLAARTLPDQPPEGLQIPASTMLFVAIAVPVMIAAAAVTVYAQRGRGELQAANIQAARQYENQAGNQKDLKLRRQDWARAFEFLDKADSYGVSQASTDLREQIQAGIDEMDGIKRVSYRPALNGSLGESVKIGRMIATSNDVFVLDTSQGRVLHMVRSGAAYDLDLSFICGPVNYGSITVGKLVDISLLPPDNAAKASVLGVDNAGNALFCSLTEKPAAVTLTSPDTSWGSLTRMVFFQDTLYLLDVQNNQVVRFQFKDGLVDKEAHQFFGNQVPHLADVVDIAVDQEYLYILHADGAMTTCTNTGATTACDDPMPYGDNRAGQDPAPIKFNDAQLVLMQASQPPDPSLYALDGQHASIYHFSLRKLNLQDQFRPLALGDYPPKGQAITAFLITPNRRAMLAAGNQIYFGLLP